MSSHAKGIIYVLLGAVFFSAKAVFVKLAYLEGLDSIETLSLRVSFALPFYLASVIWIFSKKSDSRPQHDYKLYFLTIVYGFLGYYLASYFDFLGLQYITASLERLVLFVYPTFVVILNFIFYKKRIRWIDVFALVITYFGVALAYIHDVQLGGDKVTLGASLILLSAITYAVYLMGSGNLIPKLGSNLFTSIAMITACVIILFHFSILRDWSRFLEFSPYVYFLGFLLGIFTTVVPSYLVSAGIGKIGSSEASIVSSAGPLSTVILAYILLGEDIGLYQILGTFFVLFGVWMISRKKKTVIPIVESKNQGDQ
ncbi:DMT family transporter [Leptospira sp. GIMC2001]|uniref:DMT family transporter n=1 Tax=Leptospira sp. GIMC2001 TaxID=1513297 RepID=UPI00234BBAC6|nr:DMT family transporter [Leptospira sp. GIMC2001]WCL48946.1 DMT family transporter [Leptospira sp. GIMC2001]